MGTTAHLITVGARTHVVDDLVSRLGDLERRWTRFSATSELSQLNSASGAVTVVEPDTFRLIASAVEGWHRTKGSYDPTVLASMTAQGYDTSFENIGPAPTLATTIAAPGCGDIDLMPQSNAVQLPIGIALDFGGIGKGFAADVLCDETMSSAAASGLCVNIGGDVRVHGEAPTSDGWIIGLAATAVGGNEAKRVALGDGAVCTSRTDLRTWTGPEGQRHHLLDPRTGKPTETDMTAISVIAGSAAVAELVTKAAIVSGVAGAATYVEEFGASALALNTDGALIEFGNIKDYLA